MTAPTAIWDARASTWPQLAGPRRSWLEDHGVPTTDTYRIEFYDAAAPIARLFTFHLNGAGRRHLTGAHTTGAHDHDQCAAAVNDPYDMPITELPPARLL